MRQLWSLAFEEQFYLVWPTLLWWTARRRIATQATLLLCLATVAVLLVTALLSVERPERIYTLPTTWAAPVLIGCLAALHRDSARALVRPTSRAGLPLLAVSVVVVLWCCTTWEFTELAMYLGGPAIAGLACLVLVLWLEDWSVVRSRWLRPIVGLGTVSYAAYLWNYPVVMYVHEFVEDVPTQIALSTALTVVMAVLSWYLVEKPTQRWRARVTGRKAAAARKETAPV
jgi:peptidoglycan/LPS O-acetylase OafA/YrhL